MSTTAAAAAAKPALPPLVAVSAFSPHAKDGHIEYSIKFCGKLTARRRFREFLLLRNELKRLPSRPLLPKLPSRFFNTSPVDRVAVLNDFLVAACNVLDNEPQIHAFLRVDAATFAREWAKREGRSAQPSLKLTIGEPKFPPKFADRIVKVRDEVLQIQREAKDGVAGWKQIGSKDNWTWLARPAPNSNRVVMGEIKNCTPRVAHEFFMSNAAAMDMEVNIAKIIDLERLDEHTTVQYFGMKSIMWQACRDVIFVRHWSVVHPDGTICHAEFSLDAYPGAPENGAAGTVRAVMTCGGAIIAPVEGDPNSCRVWRINNLDPMLGSNIPEYATKKLNELTSSMLSANMFALERLVREARAGSGKHRELYVESLKKGPLVNWNGKVEGGGGAMLVGLKEEGQDADKARAKAMEDRDEFDWIKFWDVLILLACFAAAAALLEMANAKRV